MNNDRIFIYGGFWRRFFAFFIDIVVVVIILEILLRILGYPTESEANITFRQNGLQNFAILTAYFVLMEISSLQGTIGKMVFGLKVTNENGKRISFLKSLIRNVSKLISSLILNIGFLMIAFTKRKQGLHDIIAKCLVVKRTPNNTIQRTLNSAR